MVYFSKFWAKLRQLIISQGKLKHEKISKEREEEMKTIIIIVQTKLWPMSTLFQFQCK